MIGPFPRRSLVTIGGLALSAALLLGLAGTSIPTGAVDSGRYVTDPGATGPAVGSTFSIPATQPLARGGSWVDAADRHTGVRLIVVDFFATWCPPCQQETPILRSFDRTYGERGLLIVGVSVGEAADDVAAYASRYGLDYPIALDVDGALFRAAAAGGLPTKVLLDAGGRVIAVLPRPFTVADGPGLIEPLLAP